ncbi:hypothetical protein HY933_03620 [Candidatus Falkowbacteria bacterium]|nr:hypothetical protein [Candidatus Falkowbacteria bacterium]
MVDWDLAAGEVIGNDIAVVSTGVYRVTGPHPEIVFRNLDLDPAGIKNLQLTVIPKNNYLWQPYHVYWTTNRYPGYHEYHRNIWVFRDVLSLDAQSENFQIPVCRYPAFVFSDSVQDIKLTLPFVIGEDFSLQ